MINFIDKQLEKGRSLINYNIRFTENSHNKNTWLEGIADRNYKNSIAREESRNFIEMFDINEDMTFEKLAAITQHTN